MIPFVVLLALVGACIGSFLNVVAWRLPRQESVVWPGSHCPNCGHAVRWHDNLPVFGWLLLQGRCRDCHWRIPVRYPLVELLTAGLWLTAIPAVGLGATPAQATTAQLINLTGGVVLVSLLMALTLIDLDHLWLPEPLCRAGVISGWITVTWMAASSTPFAADRLLAHLLAACAGLLVLEGISNLAERALGQPALGLGDAKLAAMGGAWLGPLGLAASMMLAVLGGAVVGSAARLSGRLGPREPFPFGPFIAAGIWLVWLKGAPWWWQLWLAVMGQTS